jgi:hypothetical protein
MTAFATFGWAGVGRGANERGLVPKSEIDGAADRRVSVVAVVGVELGAGAMTTRWKSA